jgi:hypothetical protein
MANGLSVGLKADFPDVGLSSGNIWNMKRFYEQSYLNDPKLRRSVAVLSWRHDSLFPEKNTEHDEAIWYAPKVV